MSECEECWSEEPPELELSSPTWRRFHDLMDSLAEERFKAALRQWAAEAEGSLPSRDHIVCQVAHEVRTMCLALGPAAEIAPEDVGWVVQQDYDWDE